MKENMGEKTRRQVKSTYPEIKRAHEAKAGGVWSQMCREAPRRHSEALQLTPAALDLVPAVPLEDLFARRARDERG